MAVLSQIRSFGLGQLDLRYLADSSFGLRLRAHLDREGARDAHRTDEDRSPWGTPLFDAKRSPELSVARRAVDRRLRPGRVPGRDLGLAGCVPGQAAAVEDDADAPRAGYRDRIIAAVVVGLMLILWARLRRALARASSGRCRSSRWDLGLVLYLIAHNRRYRHASPTLRRHDRLFDRVLERFAAGGILIVVNVIAFRYGGRPIDMTRERNVLALVDDAEPTAGLDRPVTFTMIFGDGVRASRQHDRVVQLAGVVQGRQSPDDPVSEPEPIQRPDAARRAGQARARARNCCTAAARAGRCRRDRIRHGRERPVRGGAQRRSCFSRSRSIRRRAAWITMLRRSRARTRSLRHLIRLREGKRSKVAFTTGHGEPVDRAT